LVSGLVNLVQAFLKLLYCPMSIFKRYPGLPNRFRPIEILGVNIIENLPDFVETLMFTVSASDTEEAG